MAAKKKSSEDYTSPVADGIFAVAHEEIRIVWEDSIYHLTPGINSDIPLPLYAHLSSLGKVNAVEMSQYEKDVKAMQEVEEVAVEETPVVEEPEVSVEEAE